MDARALATKFDVPLSLPIPGPSEWGVWAARNLRAMAEVDIALIAYTVVGGSRWVRIGRATRNADGSLELVLDALPANGRIQLREEPCFVEGDAPGTPESER